MKTVIEMAQEAGLVYLANGLFWMDAGEPGDELERLVELARADEREICSALDFRKEIGLTSDQDYKVSQLILFGGNT